MNLKELLGDAYKENMTLEEIDKVLDKIDLSKDSSEQIKKLKNSLDKASSEAANYKKQLREKMTEDEQKTQKEAEERAELEEKYNKLLRETEITKHKAKFLSLGYDEKLADETAEALMNNDLAKVFSNQKQFQDSLEKKIRAEVLKDTPKPVSGSNDQKMTKEKFMQLSPTERHNFYLKHPEEYKELYKGEENGK